MFIVIEGIDGAGKGRQREELLLRLSKDKTKKITSIEFPDHNNFLYKELIKPVLLQKKKSSQSAMFLAFALDQLLHQEKIKQALGSKEYYFICDGYFTTNIAYNCILNKYFDVKTALQFAKIFKLNMPDINIFIDVEPEVCLARKKNELGHEQGLDIYEKSISKQKKLQKAYISMIKKQIFGKWIKLDGNGSILEVSQLIFESLKKNKYI
jgi:dTMP kinase